MVKVAAIQLGSGADVQKNVEMACELIAKAAREGALLAALPENFATLGLSPAESYDMAENFQSGKIQKRLSHTAKVNKIWLVGGTLPLLSDSSKKVFSTSLVWDTEGEVVARYDKIHLFDVMVQGKEIYKESEKITPGNEIVLVSTPFGKMGLAVCYDIRFPELFRAFMLQGADMIILPSAFTVQTGSAHWEILLRARAIENLCYMIAPAEVGFRSDGRPTYGHSMIVGPWGEILAEVTDGNAVISATLDLKEMRKLREQFPSLTHYRPFIMEGLVKEVHSS